MKHELIISRRYAEALVKSASEVNSVEVIRQDLELLKSKIQSFKSRKMLLSSSMPKLWKKKAMKDMLVGTNIHNITRNFIDLILENNRVSMIYFIIDSYENIVLSMDGKIVVSVDSFVLPDMKLCQKIEKYVHKLMDVSPIINYNVRKDLLGGAIIKVNNKMLDISLKGYLDKIRRSLLAGSINK